MITRRDEENDWREYRRLIQHLLDRLEEQQDLLRTDHEQLRKEMAEQRRMSEEDLETLHDLAKDWERYKWLWGLVIRSTVWTIGVGGAIWGGRDIIVRVWKALFL